jgi:HD superfamily phosphodiesterase
MNRINHDNAEHIALEYFSALKDNGEKEFNIIHSKAVVEIVSLLGMRVKADIDNLVAAAWVHDIGKTVSISDHAKHSVELLIKDGYTLTLIQEDCILNHGTGSTPKTREGRIIQAADKLSILSIPILELLLKQKKILETDIDFIIKMTKGAIEHLRFVDEI